MSRPGSERHKTKPREASLQSESWLEKVRTRVIRVKSGSITHTTHTHTRAPWPQHQQGASNTTRKQQFRLGQVLAAWVQDRAAGQGRAGHRMQEGRGWVSAFRWPRCYPRRKWNGPAPKNEVPGDWPPSLLALSAART